MFGETIESVFFGYFMDPQRASAVKRGEVSWENARAVLDVTFAGSTRILCFRADTKSWSLSAGCVGGRWQLECRPRPIARVAQG